jgi:DNA topoisomerase-1
MKTQHRKSTAVPPRSAIEPAGSTHSAASAGLVYVSDVEPGYRRMRGSSGFFYLGLNGKRLKDKSEIERIAKLAVPPAYEDVWICADPDGHLQATGRDARGRKQYRYHAGWRVARDEGKFDRMPAFGEALPRLRRRVRRDLNLPGLPRDKVLALVVHLLDATRIRIGNAEYARDNNSYGLTTLRNRHVVFDGDDRAVLKFRGKGGIDHEVQLRDKRSVKILRSCQQLPGRQLFQYVDESGARRRVDSEQVNEYLRDVMGDEFTAKDFRTWGATLRAIALMAGTPMPERSSERALKSCILAVIREVALELRNTPTVCRKSYINPLVFSAWRTGVLRRVLGASTGSSKLSEWSALHFLRRAPAMVARIEAAGSAPKNGGLKLPPTARVREGGRYNSQLMA